MNAPLLDTMHHVMDGPGADPTRRNLHASAVPGYVARLRVMGWIDGPEDEPQATAAGKRGLLDMALAAAQGEGR